MCVCVCVCVCVLFVCCSYYPPPPNSKVLVIYKLCDIVADVFVVATIINCCNIPCLFMCSTVLLF